MTRIRADFARSSIPDDIKIGDHLTIHGTAHVTGIVADHVDISRGWGRDEYMPGEITVTLIITADLEKPA